MTKYQCRGKGGCGRPCELDDFTEYTGDKPAKEGFCRFAGEKVVWEPLPENKPSESVALQIRKHDGKYVKVFYKCPHCESLFPTLLMGSDVVAVSESGKTYQCDCPACGKPLWWDT